MLCFVGLAVGFTPSALSPPILPPEAAATAQKLVANLADSHRALEEEVEGPGAASTLLSSGRQL